MYTVLQASTRSDAPVRATVSEVPWGIDGGPEIVSEGL